MTKEGESWKRLVPVAWERFVDAPETESEMTDDLFELATSLQMLECAIVDVRDSLLNVVAGLAHNMVQESKERDRERFDIE